MAWEMMLLNSGSKGQGGWSSYLHLVFVLPILNCHLPLPPTPALADHITHGFIFFFPSVFSLHSWSLNVSKGCCAAAGEVAKPQSLSDRAPLTGALSHWLGKVCPASDGHVHGPPPYVSTQASGLRGSENVDVVGLSGSVASSEEEKCLPLPIVDREFCG